MTIHQFEQWLSENPAKTRLGYSKLMDISGLSYEEVRDTVSIYRYLYEESLKNIDQIKADKPVFKSEFQKIGSKTGKYNIPGIHIVFPCVHIPHENTAFMNAALDLIEELGDKVVGFHIIGDFLDMSALSSHDRGNITKTTLFQEYKAGNEWLDIIQQVLPKNVLKTYIYGNHEDRYFRYMRHVDNAKLGDALQSPTAGLKLHQRGFRVFEDWKNSVVTLGHHFDLFHGEFTNVHTCKKHLDTYRRSCGFAHTHRKQIFIEGNHGAYNFGSMADFESEAFGYATRAMKESWTNSMGVVTIDKQGNFHVEIPTWYNNQLVFGGNIY